MPGFRLTDRARAPIEEVWKLLHDPARFPDWWAGVETVRSEADGRYTMWPVGYPDFPMAQLLDESPGTDRVVISCLVSDLVFSWQLGASGEATDITVAVEIPEREAHRVPDQRALLARSIRTLAELAERESQPLESEL